MRAQMSVKRFVECHKFIWQYIANELEKRTSHSVSHLKAIAVEKLLENDMIDSLEYKIVSLNNNCFLCSHFERCFYCPLGRCNCRGSLYAEATIYRKIEAAEKIRDIVDYLLEREEDSIFIYERFSENVQ